MSLVEAAKAAADGGHEERCEVKDSGDDRDMTYYGKQIVTVADLLAHAEIDLNIWDVVESSVNNWEVAGRLRKRDKLWKTGLRQIKVRLKRRAPKHVQDAIAGLVANWKPKHPKPPPKQPKRNKHLLEVGLYDHHFGKLCWGMETGTNYDLEIAEREFMAAIDGMLLSASVYPIEKILLPVGNDFFHTNDWHSQTANGTRVESVDDRPAKVFDVGFRSIEHAIRQCLLVAPVELLWIPGNHDRHTSWNLVYALKQVYRGYKHVSVDDGPRYRKYRSYGPTLLGYMHGDEGKPDTYPTLMATEVPELWAASKFRSWRTGHFHKRKETRYVAGDTFNGVEVRVFPSLCGTDHWHYRQGYTGSCRMAECHVFSKENGPVGHFLQHAKEPVQ